MKLFSCQHCGHTLYFENMWCERCRSRLGYLPQAATLSALEEEGEGFRALADPERSYRLCANAGHGVCNWLVPADDAEWSYCLACRHNATVPDLSNPDGVQAWRKVEEAKHRLFYGLIALKLPVLTRWEDPEHGLSFRFLADPHEGGPRVMTGHENGVITIALVEADDAERERRRTNMGEPYRTLLGHFRHEVGHHYFDLLVRGGKPERLTAFRALFGDDRADYGAALRRHHGEGAPAEWRERHISAYATMHPWEDFAETFAHYLHIVDALEMARAFGLRLNPSEGDTGLPAGRLGVDPYGEREIGVLVDAWLPLMLALNSLNRCLGQTDVYPFVLSPVVIEKLGFVHEVIHGG